MRNYDQIKDLLVDVEWDLHEGAERKWTYLEKFHGEESSWWLVENREEFALAAAAILPIVREACASGKYDALTMLGGGEPGYLAAREIARPYNIPVTGCAFSQMHIATMLGNKFSVIDLAESHNMYYYNLVVQHGFAQRCASIRSINRPLPRPGSPRDPSRRLERDKAARGEPSETVETAVKEAVAAIEEDGAEVITCGCSGVFWLQPFVQKRLNEMGWEVPVLEGYKTEIVLAKALASLGVSASGLMFPSDRPKKRQRRKIF
jgi:Asp/Glu/hydantoin racemase